MKTRVTIRDIAKATGLHFTTVALCLRDSSRLRLETRKKVQEVAKKMGYKPDPMVAALMVYRQTKRTPHFQSVLAWVNNWPDRSALRENPTFDRYYEAAGARARELGYMVEEFWLREPGMSPEKLANILKTRNIQGLLIAPQPRPYAHLEFDFTGFSAIAFGYSMQPSVLHVVANNHFRTMNTIISRLVELGYHRIGLAVVAEWNEKVESGLMAGFTLAHHWKYTHLEYILPFGRQQPKVPMKNWLDTYQPDVVIGWDEMEGELRAMGYQIPQQIGFVSMDVDPRNNHISGLYQNDLMIGQKAVDQLVGMIQRGETGVPPLPICTLIESEWRDGKTLRKQEPQTKLPSSTPLRSVRTI
ncbi:MAG: LacI family transcriptional regulator [Methylacidiphilales bacterium]|nr:LacI family transcriptional regulator [Candidatus Methylacidiphilales bacterium]